MIENSGIHQRKNKCTKILLPDIVIYILRLFFFHIINITYINSKYKSYDLKSVYIFAVSFLLFFDTNLTCIPKNFLHLILINYNHKRTAAVWYNPAAVVLPACAVPETDISELRGQHSDTNGVLKLFL